MTCRGVWFWFLLSMTPYVPLVGPNDFVLPHSPYSDYSSYQLPVREFVRSELLQKRFPHWIPHIGAGLPLHAGQQMAITYPLLTPLVLAFGTNLGIRLSLFVHVALAWWGAYRLSRGLQCSRGGSCLAALVTTQCGFVIGHLRAGHVNVILSYALLPWFFHSIAQVVRDPAGPVDGVPSRGQTRVCSSGFSQKHDRRAKLSRLSFRLLRSNSSSGSSRACRLALIGAGLGLVGHPQLGYYAGLTGVFWALLWLRQLPEGRRQLRAVRLLASSLVLAVLLSAVQTIPATELIISGLDSSSRGTVAFATQFSLQGRDLLRLLIPDQTWFASSRDSHLQHDLFAHETSGFCGILALVCAARGACVRRDHPERQTLARSLALLIAACLIISLGTDSLLFAPLHTYVPGLSLFRCPGRVLGVATILIGILAARGCDVGRRSVDFNGWTSAVQYEATSCSFFPVTAGVSTRVRRHKLCASVSAVCLAAACCELLRACIADIAGDATARPAVAGMFAFPRLACGELLLGLFVMFPVLRTQRWWRTSGFCRNHALLWLVWIEMTSAALPGFGMEPRLPVETPPNGIGLESDFRFVECDGALTIHEGNLRYARNLAAAIPQLEPVAHGIETASSTVGTNEGGVLPPAVERLFAALQHREDVVAAVAACHASFIPARSVWRRHPTALPRIRVHDESASWLLATDLGRLTPKDVRQLTKSCVPLPTLRREETAQHLGLTMHLSAPGWLVLADTWHPHWNCSVNGRQVDILPAHGVFRAVRLPAGRNEVHFRFQSESFFYAAGCSVLAAVVALTGACRVN